MATMAQTLQDVTFDWTDFTNQMHAATGRSFRIMTHDGRVRLERQRACEDWQPITEWIMVEAMELYCDAYLDGIHEGYVAAKRGH